jgi:predicted glycosyltransferase
MKKLPNTKRILQFRDIPIPPQEYFDPSEAFQEKILKEHKFYHKILVSGHPNLFNVATEYKWPKELEEKLHYCGLMVPQIPIPEPAAKDSAKRLLISFGGGWDSDYLTPLVIQTVEQLSKMLNFPLEIDLYTGPAISDQRFQELQQLESLFPTRVVRYSKDFPEVLARADVAFLQAGSTPYQILESDKPMILYTRDYATQEQQYRAELLGKFPDITIINKEWTRAHYLAELLQTLLQKPRQFRKTGLSYNGVDEAAQFILRQLPS